MYAIDDGMSARACVRAPLVCALADVCVCVCLRACLRCTGGAIYPLQGPPLTLQPQAQRFFALLDWRTKDKALLPEGVLHPPFLFSPRLQ